MHKRSTWNMVLAFFIASVSEKTSGIIYSTFYGWNERPQFGDAQCATISGDTNDLGSARGPSEMNEEQKTRSDLLKRLHQSAVEDMKNTPPEVSSSSSDVTMHLTERKGQFFFSDVDVGDSIVVWHSFGDCCFVAICDETENVGLAEYCLKLIIQSVSAHIIFLTPAELNAKIGLLRAIVELYMPSGRLLFMNQGIVKQYEQMLHKLVS
ncbi:uncharacterized protein LOC142565927 [Dermacentor variabilis]|uniref:uncharacterized protein LOC142565927 n=1 Tax=Dermacentor variabilis TaxID=34621 RepID=UPI003F5C56A4